jgi:tyrosine-specific transport protein
MFKKRGEQTTGFFAKHKLLTASFTLVGTIVGAGILGIPYVVAKAGILYGLIMIVLVGLAFLFLNLFAGEFVLRTKKQHQLTGYAEKYLGPTGKKFMLLSMLINIYGALTAYLIGEGATLHSIFKFGSPIIYTLIFFTICFIIIYQGVKATGKMELYLISLLLLVVVIIGFLSWNNIKSSNFTSFNPAFFFLPYGVVLFALMGSPAIPEMQEVLGKDKKIMKKAIIIGSLIPVVLYLVFTLIIAGVVGVEQFEVLQPNERIATVALSLYSFPILGVLANILAVLSMFTSFLTLGLALVEVYHFDYKLSRKWALGLTFIVPLILVLFNLTSFIAILGITGVIAGGLDGILVTLIYWKAKKLGDRKPEYVMGNHYILGTVLIGMFLLGIGYQVWSKFF